MRPVAPSPRLSKNTWFRIFHAIMPQRLCTQHTENFSTKLAKGKTGHGAKFAQMQLYVSYKSTPLAPLTHEDRIHPERIPV
jgi:hypothetical protein